MRYDVEVLGRVRQVQVTRTADTFTVEIDGRRWSVDAVRIDPQTLSLLIRDGAGDEPGVDATSRGGRSEEVVLASGPGGAVTARVGGIPVDVHPSHRRRRSRDAQGTQSGPQRLVAPMPGKVIRVLVKPGDVVAARQAVVVVEAMKMENELRAVRDGRVSDIVVRDGQLVDAGALLAVIVDT